MKTAILIAEGVKQIMLTPENNAETEALSYISPKDDIHTVVIKKGQFDDEDHVFGADVYLCNGGYYRAERKKDSVMFVITPKTEKEV